MRMDTINELKGRRDKVAADTFSAEFASCLAKLSMFLGASEKNANDVREHALTCLALETEPPDVVKVTLHEWLKLEQDANSN